jgi:hypothetical protein
MGERISYGPSFVPGESGIRLSQFSVADQKVVKSCVTAHQDFNVPKTAHVGPKSGSGKCKHLHFGGNVEPSRLQGHVAPAAYSSGTARTRLLLSMPRGTSYYNGKRCGESARWSSS